MNHAWSARRLNRRPQVRAVAQNPPRNDLSFRHSMFYELGDVVAITATLEGGRWWAGRWVSALHDGYTPRDMVGRAPPIKWEGGPNLDGWLVLPECMERIPTREERPDLDFLDELTPVFYYGECSACGEFRDC